MGLLVVSSDAGLGWLLVASRGREGPRKDLLLQICFVLEIASSNMWIHIF